MALQLSKDSGIAEDLMNLQTGLVAPSSLPADDAMDPWPDVSDHLHLCDASGDTHARVTSLHPLQYPSSPARTKASQSPCAGMSDHFEVSPGHVSGRARSRDARFPTCLQARHRKDVVRTLCLQGTRILQGVQGFDLRRPEATRGDEVLG